MGEGQQRRGRADTAADGVGMIWLLAFLIGSAAAQDKLPEQPKRDAYFWCQQQRNFFADAAASNAAEASKLQDELTAVKVELAELKKAQAK
jgi:hypothetical protein